MDSSGKGSPNPSEARTENEEGAPKVAEEPTLGTECSECGKPAQFFSVYQKQKTVFCSAECHGKRNKKEETPSLILVKIESSDSGNKKGGDAGTSADSNTDELMDTDLEEDIFLSCEGGLANNTILYKLLEGGADVNQKDSSDQPLFLHAVANGDVTTVNLLLEKGADVNTLGKGKTTPLMLAAEMGMKEKVTFLLSKDADTTLRDEEGKTALHRTERNRNTKCAELLIDNNPDLLQAVDNCQQTILHQAAGEGNKDLLEFLLGREADISALDNLSRSALHWAVIQGMESVVECLVERDCSKVINEPDRFGVRPIHYAIQSNRSDIAKMLIDKGCELEAGESRGLTALIYAAACGKRDMLEIMIPHCKDINITDKNGWTALHHASKRGDESVCSLLLDHRAKADLRDTKDQHTALVVAVCGKQGGVARILVDRCRECSGVEDGKGRLALHHAAELGQLDVLSALVEAQGKTGAKDKKGNTTEANSINSKDSSGHTALYLAARNSHRPCCQHLLENGAEVDELSRAPLFELGLVDPEIEEEEEEEKEEEKGETEEPREAESPRERYGVETADGEAQKIEDLDLGNLADSSAVALNSRYIYEGLAPPPKSSPRQAKVKANVIPRRHTDIDDQEAFNVQWKELLDRKRRAELGIKIRKSQEHMKSPYAQRLVSDQAFARYNHPRLQPSIATTGRSRGRTEGSSRKAAAAPLNDSGGSRGSSSGSGSGRGRRGGGGSEKGSSSSSSSSSHHNHGNDRGGSGSGAAISAPLNLRRESTYSQGKKYSYSVVTS